MMELFRVMQTLKDSHAMWSLSAWKKSAKLAAQNNKQFSSKFLMIEETY
jgi:hypothetical protein